MFIKDHQTVEAIVLGDIAGSDGVAPLYAAERIFGGPFQGLAERSAAITLDDMLNVGVVARLHWPTGAQVVEKGSFPGDDVGQLDDLLPLHGF